MKLQITGEITNGIPIHLLFYLMFWLRIYVNKILFFSEEKKKLHIAGEKFNPT